LSEFGILINADLCVDAVDVEVGSNSPWVHFDLGRVNINEHLVDLVQLFNALGVSFTFQSKVSADLVSISITQTFINTKGNGVDRFGILFGNSLDIHASLL
jgi:hypothetical protein